MSSIILPCPFCGKPPETQQGGEGGRGLMIDCITPNCVNPHVSYYDHASAIAVWNRRPGEAKLRVALLGGNVTAPLDELSSSRGPKTAPVAG